MYCVLVNLCLLGSLMTLGTFMEFNGNFLPYYIMIESYLSRVCQKGRRVLSNGKEGDRRYTL